MHHHNRQDNVRGAGTSRPDEEQGGKEEWVSETDPVSACVMDEGGPSSGKGGWGRQYQCQELSRTKKDPCKGPD